MKFPRLSPLSKKLAEKSKFIVLSTTLIHRPHSKEQNQMTHFFHNDTHFYDTIVSLMTKKGEISSLSQKKAPSEFLHEMFV